jgi:hypothetical protein
MATQEELINVIRQLRDYIANSNIPVEQSDYLYQKHLDLADSVLPRIVFCCHACEMEIIENSEDHDNCCTEDDGVTWYCCDCWSERECEDCGRVNCTHCDDCGGCIGTWNYPCTCIEAN